MDYVEIIFALVGICVVGAGQSLKRRPVFDGSAQIALVLTAVAHESGPYPPSY